MQEKERYSINAGSLNVRGEPDGRAKVVGLLRRDEVVEKLDQSQDGYWIKVRIGEVEGWSASKYMHRLEPLPAPGEGYPWMAVAGQELGVREYPGMPNSPHVLKYFSAVGNLSKLAASRDETPWCSAFVNWCMARAGYQGTRSALARSWMRWGRRLETPHPGCIVVFSREKIFGHVGFYLGETSSEILVLGGNQQNPETQLYEVCEKYYPKARWLGFRLPRSACSGTGYQGGAL